MTTHSKLLEFLIENQLLSVDVAEAAVEELTNEVRPAAMLEWLGQRGLIEEEHLAMSLGQLLGVQYVSLANYPLDPQVVCSLNEEVATAYRVVALGYDEGVLTVAVADPFDRDAVHAVESATRHPVRLMVATATGVRDAIARAYHLDAVLNAYLQGVRIDTDDVAEIDDDRIAIEGLRHHGELPSVAKLFRLILLDAIAAEATEVHIDAGASEVSVRYCIGASLREAFRFPSWVRWPLLTHCKVLASLDPAQRSAAQIGRLRVRYRQGLIDVRVTTQPQQFGESIELHVVGPATSRAGVARASSIGLSLDTRTTSPSVLDTIDDRMATLRQRTCVSCSMPLQADWQTCPYCRARIERAPLVVSHVAAPPNKPGLPAGPISADTPPERRFQVLVVDDEPDFRRIITTLLEHSGLPVSVSVATHGPEALARAEQELPDLILLDVMMPDMDGFDVCARLRANVRTTFIPILMLTALNDPASRTRGFLVGTDDYLGKPFDRAELLARVRRMLQRTYGLQASEENVAATTEPALDPGPEPFLTRSNPTVGH